MIASAIHTFNQKLKMFNKLVTIFLISASCLSAMSWQDQWAEALRCIEQERFDEAESYFERASAEKGFSDAICIDRGNLLNRLGRYQEAEFWLSQAISGGQLSKDEIWKAYGERAIARIGIDPDDGRALEDMKVFASLSPYVPKKIEGKKTLILKDVPQSPCYEKVMTCHYIHSGKCNSKHDIQKMASGDWIIHKACDCGCKPKAEQRSCDACGMDLSCKSQAQIESDCKKYCTAVGVFAYDWCGKIFAASTPCRWTCLATVFEMSDLCWYCCERHENESKCVKPLREIKQAMAQSCSAEIRDAWDD